MQISSTDSVTIAVHDLGGEGDPLVISHATGFCGRAYQQLADELASHFHVWAFDYRGHGDSTSPAGDRFDWAGMADDFLAVVDVIGTGPIDVFGHSLGGAAALLAELRRPQTLRAAFLYEPIVMPSGLAEFANNPNSMSEAALRRKPILPSRAEALLRFAGRPPLDALRAGSLLAYVEHGFEELADGSVRLKCTPEHEAATFDAPGKPTVDQLTVVETPTTVAAGTTDRGWTPAKFAPQIADALPRGRLERHETIGHFGPLEDPVGIAASIVAASRA